MARLWLPCMLLLALPTLGLAEPLSGETPGGRQYTGTVEVRGQGAERQAVATVTLAGVGERTLRASVPAGVEPTGYRIEEANVDEGATGRLRDLNRERSSSPLFRLIVVTADTDDDEADAPTGPAPTGVRLERVGTWTQAHGNVRRPAPDNTISFRATLLPEGATGTLRFELNGVSAEKGTCLNAGDGTDPDLSFAAQDGFGAPSSKGSQIARSAAGTTAVVVVTAHDYGARGTIRASVGADLHSDALNVLQDAVPPGGNGIEDAWDAAHPAEGAALAADADTENDPKPWYPGDGLSRYEEYRGFSVGGTWTSTSPTAMDVFVHDATGTGQTGDFTSETTGLSVHVLAADELSTEGRLRPVNPNRGFGTAGLQGVIRVTTDNGLSSPGLSQWTRMPHVPGTNTFTKVKAAWFSRSIRTSAAVTADATFIPVRANTNRGDRNLSWRTDGRISLGDEVMTIVAFANGDARARVRLAAPVTVDAEVVAVDLGDASWPGSGFATLGNETITWSSGLVGGTERTLQADVDATATRIRLDSAMGLYYGSSKSLGRIGDELVRIDGASRDGTIRVTRGVLGTTAAAHSSGAKLTQPSALGGVQRGVAGTTAAAHAKGAALNGLGRGFLVTRGRDAKRHAAGTAVPYFYSDEQAQAALRSTFAHECGHSLNMAHNDRNPSIMASTIAAGAFDGHGVYHVFDAFNWRRNFNLTPNRPER